MHVGSDVDKSFEGHISDRKMDETKAAHIVHEIPLKQPTGLGQGWHSADHQDAEEAQLQAEWQHGARNARKKRVGVPSAVER